MDGLLTFIGSCSFDRQVVKNKLNASTARNAGAQNSRTGVLHGDAFAIRKGPMFFLYRMIVAFPSSNSTEYLRIGVALQSIDAVAKNAVEVRTAKFFCSEPGNGEYQPMAPSKVMRPPLNDSIFAYGALSDFNQELTLPSIQFAIRFTVPSSAFQPADHLPLGDTELASKSEQYMFSRIDDLNDPWSGANYRLSSGEEEPEQRRLFSVNSAVLCSKSAYFADFFASNERWTEKTGNVMVLNYSADVLYEALMYIYLNEVEMERVPKLLPELLDAANLFNLTRLKLICHRHLVEEITADERNWQKAAEYMFLADRYQLNILKRVCSLIIIDHMEDFQRSEFLRQWLDSSTMAPIYHEIVALSAQLLRCQSNGLIMANN